MADMDGAYYANIAHYSARECSTPAVLEESGLWAYEDDLAPCQLSFVDADEAAEPENVDPLGVAALTIDTEIDEATTAVSEEAQDSKKCVDAPKPRTKWGCMTIKPFDVTEI